MKVALTLPDNSMPRTVFYERFIEAVRRNPRFINDESAADVLIPHEDTALETNWPRYGVPESALLRGPIHQEMISAYLKLLVRQRQRVCVINMHPGIQLPQLVHELDHLIVADGCMATWERALNPRTISMPALPLVAGDGRSPAKTILASFRGIASHPCRTELARLHNGSSIICQIVEAQNHAGKVDATTGAADASYADLLASSTFAFVPRGDNMFSYRLLEAMSFGCIPVVLSDGWVLPFDRLIRWNEIALHVPESNAALLADILGGFPFTRIAQMRAAVQRVYADRLCSLDAIVESLFNELEMMPGNQ